MIGQDLRIVMVSAQYTRSIPTGEHRVPRIEGPVYDKEDIPNMSESFMVLVQENGAPTFCQFRDRLIDDWKNEHPHWAECMQYERPVVKRACNAYKGFMRQIHAGQLCDELFGYKVLWTKMEDLFSKIDLQIIRQDGYTVKVALTTKKNLARAEAKIREYRRLSGDGPTVVLGVDDEARFDYCTGMAWFDREDFDAIHTAGLLL